MNTTIDCVAALIVTYNPDDKLLDCVNAISKQVSNVIIIDNGSTDDNSRIFINKVNTIDNVNVIFNNQNIGLASALNQGVRILESLNYNWAITLDQDSIATPTMAEELLSTLNRCDPLDKIAFIGPCIKDEGSLSIPAKWLSPIKHFPLLFKRIKCEGIDLNNISIIITSGALTNLSMFKDIGFFRDEFFIDYIDSEYCLRAKKNGYKIMVSAKALMYHNLGNKQEVKVLIHTFRPTFHKPFRRYYIARNQIAMLRSYALVHPHWAAFDIIASSYNLCRIIFLEDQKIQNILMIFKGYRDGLRGKFGELKA